MKFKMDQKERLIDTEIKQKASKSMAPRHDGDEDIPNLLAGGRPKSGMQTGIQG